MPVGLCECGCGQRTSLAKRTESGSVRGTPQRFLRGHNARGKRSHGGDYAHLSQTERLWARITKTDGCWLWTGGKTSAGYGLIYCDGKSAYVHRVMHRLFVGQTPKGMYVCHRCDNPSCVKPDHLFLGTNRENSLDMVAKGRAPRGTKPGERWGEHTGHKLTTEQVLAIRARYAAGGISMSALGREYGTGSGNISLIINRLRWKHLPDSTLPLEGDITPQVAEPQREPEQERGAA